ncbi:MAG: type II toxin-antitoxin system Phd/YefM family antitoxin [Halobacteriovoraceae bacterium]|jgi:PHD/YefM family antitoxin component YafN of YafNO toxin-antitoxin module|nr:type II toxin-antitoxin system Phd/YefM family antitoxin [Halobacteriovoraceae bacterium]
MENTNPKKLRAEMKDYLELAKNEPIRIQRRSGETYILMNEEEYSKMQVEIMSLQRRLLSMSNILDGEVDELPSSDELLKRFKA